MAQKQPEAASEEGERHVYIREAAEILGRRMATLRKWELLGVLPEHLRPQRGHRGWRYWTESQVEGLKEWLKETERWPGKGLPYYNPTDAKVNEAVENMRKPRANKRTGHNTPQPITGRGGTAARPRNPDDARSRVDRTSRKPVKPKYSKSSRF
jgi:hypothetical protein